MTSGNSSLGWTMVVAVAENGVIGRGNELPWRLSSDLRRFKQMTMGHCLLMGRKTYDSIGRALPGRQTIVLSRSGMKDLPAGVSVVSELRNVEQELEGGREVMVVGGAQIYAATLECCQTIWLTRVLHDIEGDVCFPTVNWDAWERVSTERIPLGPKDEYESEFQVWERRNES